MSIVHEENSTSLLWLRIAVVASFFVAAVSVLISFLDLVFYLAYMTGNLSASRHPDVTDAIQQIQKTPYPFLVLNLYNIVLWNGVIVCTIWLLRIREWARIGLKVLLGFDLIFTVIHLLWNAYLYPGTISNPGWFILLNALQVIIILIISHPVIVAWIREQDRNRRMMNRLPQSENDS